MSQSGYYYWKDRPKSNRQIEQEALEGFVEEIFIENRKCYGAKRIAAELRARNMAVNEKRVRVIMRRLNLQAKGTRPSYKAKSDASRRIASRNLLNQIFSTASPNKVWVGDITYIRTKQGWLYLCVFIDVFSRKVVGWQTSRRQTTKLVTEAFEHAMSRRGFPQGVTVHSDQGSQFSSKMFRSVLEQYKCIQSMSRRANPYDNAVVESFYKTLKTELIDTCYETREQAVDELFDYIERYYNAKRRHSALGYLSPVEFERRAADS